METFLLRQLGGIQSALRQQPLFPQAVAIDALLRRGAQVALVVDRPLRRRGTLQHAQFGQQFAYLHGFRAGQRQVMRAPRVGKLGPWPPRELPPGSASSSRMVKSSRPALASHQPADRPEMPAPTINMPHRRVAPTDGRVPSRRRWPSAWFMPSSSPGGRGGFPAGAHPARAAAPTRRRKSRRSVKSA